MVIAKCRECQHDVSTGAETPYRKTLKDIPLMKRLFIVSALALTLPISGCISNSSTSVATDHLKNFLHPPTPEEQYNKEIEILLDEKVELINKQLTNNLPLYNENKFHYLTNDKLDEIPTLLTNQVKSLKEKFAKDKGNMKQNKKLINIISATNEDFETSIIKLDSYFQNYSQEFDANYGKGVGLNVGHYCASVITPKSLCYKDINGYNMAKPSEVLVPMLLQKRLFDLYPEHKEYYQKYHALLNETINELRTTSTEIERYSVDYESKLYLKEASKITGHTFKGFDFYEGVLLSSDIGYATFRPDPNTIYDLSNFKVMQSVKGGVLLTPLDYDRFSNVHQAIFVETSKNITDNYVFRQGEAKAYLTGSKSYTSVFGANKNVYSFNIVPKNKTAYYFTNF